MTTILVTRQLDHLEARVVGPWPGEVPTSLAEEHVGRARWAAFALCVLAADHALPPGVAIDSLPHSGLVRVPLAHAAAFLGELAATAESYNPPILVEINHVGLGS